jgi:hypothetical protein
MRSDAAAHHARAEDGDTTDRLSHAGTIAQVLGCTSFMANDPFAPPPEEKRPLEPIEIEKEWGEEKAKRQATAVVADTPRPTRSHTWLWLVLGVIVAAVIAVGVVVQMQAKTKPAARAVAEGTVEIEIRSNVPAQIKVDGHNAGKTPMTVHMQKGTTPVQIENGKQIKSVVPDHDQVVDFTR